MVRLNVLPRPTSLSTVTSPPRNRAKRRLIAKQRVHVEKFHAAGGFDDQHGIEHAVCGTVERGAGRFVHAAVGRHNLRLEIDDFDHLRDGPLHEQFECEWVAQPFLESSPRNHADDFAGCRVIDDDGADEIGRALKELRNVAGRGLQ